MALPKFWATTVAKVLVGEQPCLLSAWITGHRRDALTERTDGGNLANWKAEHTKLLDETAHRFEVDGYKVTREQYWDLKGTTAIINGKADLLVRKAGYRPLIIDAKSGRPRESDSAQVLIYMGLIPLAWRQPEMRFDGRVQYRDNHMELTMDAAARLKPRVFEVMRRLGDPTQPQPSPSRDACRFCYVSADACLDRHVETASGTTEEF